MTPLFLIFFPLNFFFVMKELWNHRKSEVSLFLPPSFYAILSCLLSRMKGVPVHKETYRGEVSLSPS